jgi:hypothetical protein
MLKNNKNLIINILIFLILICLFNNRKIDKFSERKERDARGCLIDISEDSSKDKQSLKKRIKLNPETCYPDNGDCDCLPGFKCILNKCRSMGTYACINVNTGNCREFTSSSYNRSDWAQPFESDFNGFKRYCRYLLNDPNEPYLKFDTLAINGGCPINNITPSNLQQIEVFNKKNKN